MQEGKRILLSGFFLLLVIFTNGQQKVTLPDVEVTEDKVKSAPVYSGSTQRMADLQHMKLEIQPDFSNHTVNGQADLYVKPVFSPIDSIHLDAKKFVINQVALVQGGVKVDVPFLYDGAMLHIYLTKTFTKDDVVHLYIDYVAQPDSIKGRDGRAIRKGKGFYFIDETEEYARSFWTQGEPESNSGWFPTIDKPFEKFTHQIGITVDTAWQTLSNGELEFRTLNDDGTKTDYWLMNKPHAPYLVMVAAGTFDTVGTRWNNIPVRYFVEPAWKNSANKLFEHTIEILTLYSNLFDVPYMWQKYDQIVVRDYVSGAMENTTATVHGTSIYRDERALADNTGEDVIAHEIMHQWFGDFVTCKSWSYIPLNEGFASFGEYLWHEYKYGKDDLDWYLNQELNGYLREYNRGKVVKLIRTEYNDPDDMFDSHSYNKSGRVIQMLRTIVGDEAFFASLNKYLTDNAYQAVELDDLRVAFEKTTGQDLRWFFDQWFLQPGHPQLAITNTFAKEKGRVILTVKQTQDVLQFPVYRLPVAVDVYTQKGVERFNIVVDKQEQNFEFPVLSQPFLVKFDAENSLIAEVDVVQTDAFWLHQLGNSKNVIDRHQAAEHMLQTKNPNLLSTVAGIAMADKFWAVQLQGLASASRWDETGKKKLQGSVKKLLDSKNTRVRAKAIEVWSSFYDATDEKLFSQNIEYISYNVNEAALKAMGKIDPKRAAKAGLEGLNAQYRSWAGYCTELVALYGTAQDFETALPILQTKSMRLRLEFYINLADNIKRGGAEGKKAADMLADAANTDADKTIRYYAQKLLTEAANSMEEDAKTATEPAASTQKEMVKYARAKLETIKQSN